MLARDRVDLLVDPGTAFLELSPLAAYGLYGGDVHSASIVTGIGRVAGRECVIVANDATVKGGTYYPMTVKKHLRAQDIARRTGCRASTWSTPGAHSCRTGRGLPRPRHFGRIFYNQAQMSSQGIPQIAIVMGSCTAGGAYVPAMSDEGIIVRNQGTIFLGGPPLVKAATGEVVTAEELGGGDLHSRLRRHRPPGAGRRAMRSASRAASSRRCIRDGRNWAGAHPASRADPRPRISTAWCRPTSRKPYDVREVIARVVDGSEFDEFKSALRPDAGHRLRPHLGLPVGIVGNNGILFSESALKGAHFIELCDQRRHPAGLPAEHHRLHGRQEVRGRRHRQATAPRW
jgi:3-methylcrotonyl-CoA carboxylase beta subunit